MKSIMSLTTVALFLVLLAGGAFAQDPDPAAGNGNGVCQFVDEDGDGFNDLAPDADGDGIPNGLDPDYVRPEDGTGNQHQNGLIDHLFGKAYLKAFGEDASGYRWGAGSGGGFGPGESGPADGSGFGPGTGAGDADPEGDGAAAQNQMQTGRK